MTSPLAYALWLNSKASPRPEIMRGLHAAAPGKIDDPDVKPGQKTRAGGYGEERGVYSPVLFAPPGEEPRTVHLGLDIFAPARAEVLAPLDGRVHSFADNAREGDYGPTIILEHEPEPGLVFHTLYGHLARASLDGLHAGKTFAAGTRLAVLGAREENGGWAPHLHFQIILDIGEWKGDYPGVCKRSEQAHWLARCPDPGPLLGVEAQPF
jgi:murein DD-endopeptidase MepM/ murein hydrolase activator NlpD